MAFNARGGLLALETLLTAIRYGDGQKIQHVYIGRPKAPVNALSATITLGQHDPERWAGEQLVRQAGSYLVTLFYRVGTSDERTAELAIAELLDAVTLAIYRDPTLGGVSNTTVINTSLANDPRYLLWSGEEFREYPILVAVLQRDIAPIDVDAINAAVGV